MAPEEIRLRFAPVQDDPTLGAINHFHAELTAPEGDPKNLGWLIGLHLNLDRLRPHCHSMLVEVSECLELEKLLHPVRITPDAELSAMELQFGDHYVEGTRASSYLYLLNLYVNDLEQGDAMTRLLRGVRAQLRLNDTDVVANVGGGPDANLYVPLFLCRFPIPRANSAAERATSGRKVGRDPYDGRVAVRTRVQARKLGFKHV